jgi:hypothetical protein
VVSVKEAIMKCRVLKTLSQYDTAIKDVLGYVAWVLLYAVVIYAAFKA